MGTPRRRRSDRAGRASMRSPGRPPVARREDRQRFWAAIAAGLSSEEAGVAGGVSPAVGVRWFRESGGMPWVTQASLSGRYLSFAEREEIALLRARGCGVRETARLVRRAASTVSRELRRNAATRSGGLEYRATTAQWHADRRARRPKPAKLVVNAELRRPGSLRWRCAPAGRDRRGRPAGTVDRSASRSPQGPALGALVEPGADRWPAPPRVPR